MSWYGVLFVSILWKKKRWRRSCDKKNGNGIKKSKNTREY